MKLSLVELTEQKKRKTALEAETALVKDGPINMKSSLTQNVLLLPD